jgi:hypothetical protein
MASLPYKRGEFDFVAAYVIPKMLVDHPSEG